MIGVSAYEETASWTVWTERAALVPTAYLDAIRRAGGVPVVLPGGPDAASELLDRVDGLVVVGGPDVDPDLYGAKRHEKTDEPRVGRDRFESELLAEAYERALPTLAVCRGMQLLNVVRHGTLHQHLPDVLGHSGHSTGADDYLAHDVEVEPGSLLAKALGTERLRIASHHHQGIDVVGEGLEVDARADDGTIEGLEDPSRDFYLGVQWHPEVDEDDVAIFEALVDAARRGPKPTEVRPSPPGARTEPGPEAGAVRQLL